MKRWVPSTVPSTPPRCLHKLVKYSDPYTHFQIQIFKTPYFHMYHTTMSHQLIFINLQSLCQSQYNYYHPSPHVAPVAPQVIPSPLKGRKRQRNAAGQGGGGGKRQWVPAPI